MKVKDAYLQAVLEGREFLLFDGAMGTMLQRSGLEAGEVPESLNVEHPETVGGIHAAYVQAGAQAVTTNTFGANAQKMGDALSVEQAYESACGCVRASGARYVVGDIGPTGALLKPLGTMDFEEACDLFAQQVLAADMAGADIILIETMGDLLEMKAAVIAAKENCDLPIFATMTFGEDGRTFLGASPEAAAITLSALGVQALGINCSLGPADLVPLLRRMAPFSSVPLMVQANAGLPQVKDGATVYDIDPEEYAHHVGDLLDAGATIVGGCCGTDPRYIEYLARTLEGRTPVARAFKPRFAVCSAQKSVVLEPESRDAVVVGERINPTGKPKLKQALRQGNLDRVITEALDQQEAGADILDVNVGLPEIDEPTVLSQAVDMVQGICPLPLQIDSSDPVALERAIRRYAGKPLVNSVNATAESLQQILPLVKKYGCAVVGLTLDEDGIPKTAQTRLLLARRIVDAAVALGIPKEDVVIDCLAMAASTDQTQVTQILQAISQVKSELGVKTTLGVSNISFGLPQRPLVNAVFLANALGVGLDLPIINPMGARYRDTIAAYRVLVGQDERARRFIEDYANVIDPYEVAKKGLLQPGGATAGSADGSAAVDSQKSGDSSAQSCPVNASGRDGAPLADDPASTLRYLILTGRRAQMPQATRDLLKTCTPLQAIDGCFIPALDEVGRRFETGEFFLPQLMSSSEAASAGFEEVKLQAPAAKTADKGTIVLATVKGDVHDIGKNIVKMLLENYGYEVIDLGRDVNPQAVVDAVLKNGVRLAGLSALMTTTVKSMEETIRLLREQAPDCRVMVGGAVLTPEYAQMVGADYYGKDAAEAARIAGEFFENVSKASTL